MSVTAIISTGVPARQCGSCSLCCKLLPMAERPEDVYGAIHAMVDAGVASYADYAGS